MNDHLHRAHTCPSDDPRDAGCPGCGRANIIAALTDTEDMTDRELDADLREMGIDPVKDVQAVRDHVATLQRAHEHFISTPPTPAQVEAWQGEQEGKPRGWQWCGASYPSPNTVGPVTLTVEFGEVKCGTNSLESMIEDGDIFRPVIISPDGTIEPVPIDAVNALIPTPATSPEVEAFGASLREGMASGSSGSPTIDAAIARPETCGNCGGALEEVHAATVSSKPMPQAMYCRRCKVVFETMPIDAAFHAALQARLTHCGNCDWTFGCFGGLEPCRKQPASVPEPPPKPEGEEVTRALVDWLIAAAPTVQDGLAAEWHAAIELVHARDAYGRAKYGQPLMTGDGRDTIEDARQELGDLMQYVWKARMQGLDLASIRQLTGVLHAMLREGM